DLLKIFLVLLSLPAVGGVYWLWLILRYDRPYHRIVPEDTEARVVRLLGKPYEITTRHDALEKTSVGPDGFTIAQRQLVKQYRYEVPVISGDEYIIGFDADGHAVLKAQLTSP